MATATSSKALVDSAPAAVKSSAVALNAETVQDAADIGLLKKYEPIVRYNHGELFLPTAVQGYLAECDLLMGRSQRDQEVVVPRGEVSAQVIGNYVAEPGKSLYLRLVQKPLNGFEL